MIRLIAISMSFLIFTSLNGQIKDIKYHNRGVIIQVSDTLIRANILTGEPRQKSDTNTEYYWYSKGSINSNMGGSGGKLLHGGYLAYFKNKLVISGQFSKGQKVGQWKSWYMSGKVMEISNWKNGHLEGRYIYYSEDGAIKNGIYRNGKIQSDHKKSETKPTDKVPSEKRSVSEKRIKKENPQKQPEKSKRENKNNSKEGKK